MTRLKDEIDPRATTIDLSETVRKSTDIIQFFWLFLAIPFSILATIAFVLVLIHPFLAVIGTLCGGFLAVLGYYDWLGRKISNKK
ncbi:MAG: hypothetical protein DRO11_05875 [Methanobacteriota archaeon]|nr:MAG: hypothetical protein DRO11_05875 [Euryarchaeota archaeon]